MHLSTSKRIPWRHNDINDLEKKLQKIQTKEKVLVLIESIYSGDGPWHP